MSELWSTVELWHDLGCFKSLSTHHSRLVMVVLSDIEILKTRSDPPSPLLYCTVLSSTDCISIFNTNTAHPTAAQQPLYDSSCRSSRRSSRHAICTAAAVTLTGHSRRRNRHRSYRRTRRSSRRRSRRSSRRSSAAAATDEWREGDPTSMNPTSKKRDAHCIERAWENVGIGLPLVRWRDGNHPHFRKRWHHVCVIRVAFRHQRVLAVLIGWAA